MTLVPFLTGSRDKLHDIDVTLRNIYKNALTMDGFRAFFDLLWQNRRYPYFD